MPPQNAKRKRVSESAVPLQTTPPDKHVIFTQWAQDRGVVINGVAAAQLPGRGMGLVSTKRVKAGERLLFIPEKAMFKPNGQLLKDEGLAGVSPQAQLAISAMVKFCSSDSGLQTWRSTLPTFEDFEESMPMLCDGEIQKQLPPPVLQPLERHEADYNRDEAAMRGFLDKEDLEEQDFRYWWLIVNSRSFHWKPPLAKGGVMVLCPFVDYMNHAPTGQGCDVKMTNKGYEVVATRIYSPGEEILATYGSHSNDKLLVHYGFICQIDPDQASTNADDDIRLDHVIIPELSEEVRSRLQDVGFLGGYALLPANNDLCFKTQVAIRATCLTANEWEYFMQNGEDLGEDQSFRVDMVVKAMCGSYLQQAEHARRALNQVEQTSMAVLVSARWAQIVSALEEFTQKVEYEEKKRKRQTSSNHVAV